MFESLSHGTYMILLNHKANMKKNKYEYLLNRINKLEQRTLYQSNKNQSNKEICRCGCGGKWIMDNCGTDIWKHVEKYKKLPTHTDGSLVCPF